MEGAEMNATVARPRLMGLGTFIHSNRSRSSGGIAIIN